MAESLSVRGRSQELSKPSTIGTSTFGNGTGGRTEIVAENVIVSEGATIAASTFGGGNAGQLSIAAESIRVEGENSSISAQAQILDEAVRAAFFLPDVPTGNTGTLDLRANRVRVSDDGHISVQHDGIGNAGQSNAMAGSLQLQRGGQISAATASGLGGNLRVNVRDGIYLDDGSAITVNATGEGNGGNIAIEATTLVLNGGSAIDANAIEGNGGNVRVAAKGVFVSSDSGITASSNLGIDGSIDVVGFETEADVGLPSLYLDPVDAAALVSDPCDALRSGSEFVVSGRGGLPNDPFSPIEGRQPWRDLRSRHLARRDALPETPGGNRTFPRTDVSQRGERLDDSPGRIGGTVSDRGFRCLVSAAESLLAAFAALTPDEGQVVGTGLEGFDTMGLTLGRMGEGANRRNRFDFDADGISVELFAD
ncbi:hypothetical protein POG22_09975 [Geitlerinema sp. CS-897]|nr:hypothetical protein [Geitlerinema sp. CS-897]